MDVLLALAGVVAVIVLPITLMACIGWLAGRRQHSARRLDRWDRKH